MELCFKNHDEIVYEKGGRYDKCPLCEANAKIVELEKELEEAQDAINNHG